MLTVVNKGEVMISKSTEEYLKTIYILIKQNSSVRVTDIAKKMNCSKPSVTKQLNILKNSNLIEYESYGNIKLTSKGETLARKVLADYDIVYILLHDIVGIDEESSKIEASKIKGVIDEKTLSKIANYIYEELELNKLNCNFNIRNEECRKCAINNERKKVC